MSCRIAGAASEDDGRQQEKDGSHPQTVRFEDVDFVQVALMKHVTLTGSRYAAELLEEWDTLRGRVVKVMPREYKKALAAEAMAHWRAASGV